MQPTILFGSHSYTDDKPQILEIWRTKRIIEHSSCESKPPETSFASSSAPTSLPPSSGGPGSAGDVRLSRGEISKCVEENRNDINGFGNDGVFKPALRSCPMAIKPKPVPLQQARVLRIRGLYRLCTRHLSITERKRKCRIGIGHPI